MRIGSVNVLLRIVLLGVVMQAAFPASAAKAWHDPDGAGGANQSVFPVPPELLDALYFWRQVFGVWTRSTVVLHDDTDLSLIYEVTVQPERAGGSWSPQLARFAEQRRARLQTRLRSLELALDARRPLSEEEAALYKRIVESTGSKAWVGGASRRVRIQLGMREKFRAGLQISGRYQPWFEKIFRAQHLPKELALIPHIESSFQTSAKSPVGAVGVWQLMPETARTLLRIDEAMDERLDPIISARVAAQYFKDAYRMLADWGLAVTAYNHGVEGMLRAKAEFGGDLGRILTDYRGRNFGFASRNFYPEFLAVTQIVADLRGYFPEGVKLNLPWKGVRVAVPKAATTAEIADLFDITTNLLVEANPALTDPVINAQLAIPAGVELWLPNSGTGKGLPAYSSASDQDGTPHPPAR